MPENTPPRLGFLRSIILQFFPPLSGFLAGVVFRPLPRSCEDPLLLGCALLHISFVCEMFLLFRHSGSLEPVSRRYLCLKENLYSTNTFVNSLSWRGSVSLKEIFHFDSLWFFGAHLSLPWGFPAHPHGASSDLISRG